MKFLESGASSCPLARRSFPFLLSPWLTLSCLPACLPSFLFSRESFSMCPAQARSHSSAFCSLPPAEISAATWPDPRIPGSPRTPGCPAFSGTLASAPRCLVVWRVPLKGQSLKRRRASFTTLCSGLLAGCAAGCQRVLLPSPGLSAASAACPPPQLGWSQHSRRGHAVSGIFCQVRPPWARYRGY